MSKKFENNKKNVVIVGGGYAGIHAVSYVAKKLDTTKYNLVLVNPKPYYTHLIAALRMTVSDLDNLEETALVPYDKLPCAFVQAKVNTIQETGPGKGGVLILDNGEQLDYTALVLATGSRWPGLADFGDTDRDAQNHIRLSRGNVARAKNIVITGGGAVGIGRCLRFFGDHILTSLRRGRW
jgi:apoptosis-inducing factor 2